jgi:hypothetical protein
VWGQRQRSQARAQLAVEGEGGGEAVRWRRGGSSVVWMAARQRYGVTMSNISWHDVRCWAWLVQR